MDEGELSGRQILDHFATRLHSAEASLTRIFHVRRLPRAPSDVAELDKLRNTYDAEPVIFPATWIPCWTNVLESSSVLHGLESLLSGIVQVEAFQLQYKACNEEESKNEFQGDTLHISTPESQEQLCKINDQSKSFCSFSLVGKREDTQDINFNISLNRSRNRGFSNDEDQNDSSMVGNTYSRSLTATAGMCVETTSVIRLYHPIPSSSSEVIDFGIFMSELNSALLHKRDQLWYLTWRGIPSLINLESSLVSTEFDFWIRSLFYPTTSPQFISEDAIVQRNLWVGAIVTSRIHFDALDNIHVCISGKKLIHLYPPSALLYIHPKPWREGALNNFSSIESIFLVNWRQHANFLQNAKCWRAEVKAGEAIFIPAGWWHEVFTFEESVSANVWFKPNQVASFRATLMHLKSESYYKFMLQRTERWHQS